MRTTKKCAQVEKSLKFSFEPKSHVELLLQNGMADYERGAKVAGFRGYFLKNDGARLVWALERFVEDRFMNRTGFTPMIVPSIVRRESFVGTGYLPQSEEDLYKTQDEFYLAGTAEVGAMGYYMDEILDKRICPLSFLRSPRVIAGKLEATVKTPREFSEYTNS